MPTLHALPSPVTIRTPVLHALNLSHYPKSVSPIADSRSLQGILSHPLTQDYS